MKALRMLSVAVVLMLGAGLNGCAMFNEGEVNYSRTTTIGRELLDLEEAKDEGVITRDEYDRLREEIMRGGPVVVEKWH